MSDTSKILDLLATNAIDAATAERLLKAVSGTTTTRSTTTSKSRSNTSAAKAKPSTQDAANDAWGQVMALKPPYGTGKRIAGFSSRMVHDGTAVDDAVAHGKAFIEAVQDKDDPKEAMLAIFELVSEHETTSEKVEAMNVVFETLKAKKETKATK